jgi:uncharacterized membrane protein
LSLAAIVLMALATYATRAGGLWLANRFELSGRVEAWLARIPGAILVALVAPAVLREGLAGLVAAGAVVFVAVRTGSLVGAMVTGVAAVLALRALTVGLA